jgi:hypothetical protein
MISENVIRTHNFADRGLDQCNIAERLQGHPPDAVVEVSGNVTGELERKPCLPDAPRSDDGEATLLSQQHREVLELSDTADQATRRHGDVRPMQAAKRRKLVGADLIKPLRAREILEAMLAEIPQLVPSRQ